MMEPQKLRILANKEKRFLAIKLVWRWLTKIQRFYGYTVYKPQLRHVPNHFKKVKCKSYNVFVLWWL